MSLIHEYPVTVQWVGGVEGTGHANSSRSMHFMPLSVPPEFKGPGAGTNPEELLTSAIAGCYSITLGIILTNRKVPFVDIKLDAVGRVEQSGATTTYKSVTLRPTIHLAYDATEEQTKMALDMAHRADAYCIVTNTVRDKVEIIVEPNVEKG